jgi:hypothetical protein
MDSHIYLFDITQEKWIECTIVGRVLGERILLKSSDKEYNVKSDSYLLSLDCCRSPQSMLSEYRVRERLKKIEYWWFNKLNN